MWPDVRSKLERAGLAAKDSPSDTWLALHAAIGDRATLIDRYQLEALHRRVDETALSAADRQRMQDEVIPVLFPGWTRRGGPSGVDPIVVEDYDDAWPGRFEKLRACLERELIHLDVVIEHMGSTAVPGLAAKPVIDVMVGVPDVEHESAYVEAIENCGVSYRSGDDGHRYFKPMPPLPRVAQVHVVDAGSEWQRRHLLFRDYLRAHPRAAQAYGELKKRLAAIYRDDRLAYNGAKTDFILDHMELAEAWAANSP